MISFIVIGKNEGWKLTNCLTSIRILVKENNLSQYDIIYVDSGSSDDSLQRAKAFDEVKCFVLTGSANSAIARNIGASEAAGNVLFFVDGDMELVSDFLELIYTEQGGLNTGFVSGKFINYYYDSDNSVIAKDEFKEDNFDRMENVTGGLFVINKKDWVLVNGMDNKFRISQDIDLGLRMAKKGKKLLRKKEVAAIHHTKEYLGRDRIWNEFFKANHLYARSLLYRKHIFNKFIYPRILTNDYSLLFLLLSVLIAVITKQYLICIGAYFCIIIFKVVYKQKKIVKIPELILYFILRDLTSIFGFIFFWPSKISQIEYKSV